MGASRRVANPDPAWYGNGIVDAMYSVVDSFYGWGDAFLYITSRYADGYPSGFTVLNPANISVEVRRGIRMYRSGQVLLNQRTTSSRSRATPSLTRCGGRLRSSPTPPSNGLLAAADLVG